jgi:hypothetical protein
VRTKILKRLLEAIVMLITVLTSEAQERSFIVGQVMNNRRAPLPFASVGYFNLSHGTSTDSTGAFRLIKQVGDSLKISHIGYTPKVCYISDSTDSVFVYLSEDVGLLNDVVVSTNTWKADKIEIGHKGGNDYFLQLTEELQVAVFIPNEKNLSGSIDKISFGLKDFKHPRFNLRIRVLTVNPVTNLPERDLLTSNNIVDANRLHKSMSITLPNGSVKIPADGFFVSFEWLPLTATNGSNFLPPKLVGHTNADKNYMYNNFKEIKWFASKSKSFISDGYRVPNVIVEVRRML